MVFQAHRRCAPLPAPNPGDARSGQKLGVGQQTTPDDSPTPAGSPSPLGNGFSRPSGASRPDSSSRSRIRNPGAGALGKSPVLQLLYRTAEAAALPEPPRWARVFQARCREPGSVRVFKCKRKTNSTTAPRRPRPSRQSALSFPTQGWGRKGKSLGGALRPGGLVNATF